MLSPPSYLVTDLLDTDLQELLKSQLLEERFTQYFLYQILVATSQPNRLQVLTCRSVVSSISILQALSIAISLVILYTWTKTTCSMPTETEQYPC